MVCGGADGRIVAPGRNMISHYIRLQRVCISGVFDGEISDMREAGLRWSKAQRNKNCGKILVANVANTGASRPHVLAVLFRTSLGFGQFGSVGDDMNDEVGER